MASRLSRSRSLAAQSWPGEAFSQNDNGAWNARFAELHADLYTAPLPAALEAQCKNKGKAASLNQVTVTGNKRSSELAATCGANTACTLEGDVDVDQNWNVGATLPTHRIRDFSPPRPCAFALLGDASSSSTPFSSLISSSKNFTLRLTLS